MIKLIKDTANRVVVTASENVTLVAPVYFLFEFISDDTLESKFFTAEDISTNICRYNEFTVTTIGATGTEDLLDGVINIPLNGYSKYNVYQMDSPTNLDPALTGGIVENGKVYFEGTSKPITTAYDDNEDNTFIAYQ
tara:strand:+ start:80 stop:490 length:411 start_codon:yes stop_codon:yes gene_type:complete